MLSEIEEMTLIDPLKESMDISIEKGEVTQPLLLEAKWKTPGVYLTQKMAGKPLVRFIGEYSQTDFLQVIIVVDDDPEDLIDNIFSAEQEMYDRFKKLRFDVRLRVIPVEESIEAIRKSTISNYDRDVFKTKSL